MHEGTDVRPDEDMSVLLYNTNKQKDGIDPGPLREPKNSLFSFENLYDYLTGPYLIFGDRP